ncbi:MAG: heavy-metal-associated domain-containing protein [Nitrospirae bacterium]|nr:heavy-metal-associated domain-containing protein [Nitrospirota bacterium]
MGVPAVDLPADCPYNDIEGRKLMGKVSLNVQREFCEECSLALRRFVGKMDGVDSVDVESGKIVIRFDDSKVDETDIVKISKDSVEKLGYKILD